MAASFHTYGSHREVSFPTFKFRRRARKVALLCGRSLASSISLLTDSMERETPRFGFAALMFSQS